MSLKEYQAKRNFKRTPEPMGEAWTEPMGEALTERPALRPQLRFVVQKHAASRLHYDFRLEMDGSLKSWAVPKGPSLNPLDQRLALQTEDHPIEYGAFEGVIPPRQYGAGAVMIWDSGVYFHPDFQSDRANQSAQAQQALLLEGLKKGRLRFFLLGHKLRGEFALIKTQSPRDKKGNSWLLVKKRDSFASTKKLPPEDETPSVKTGRSLEEIASEAQRKNEIWVSQSQAQSFKGQWVPPPAEALALFFSGAPRPGRVMSIDSKKTKNFPLENTPATQKPRPERFPHRIKPMIPVREKAAFKQDGWIFEPSFKGLRAIAGIQNQKVSLYSKNGLSFSRRFPRLMSKLARIPLDLVLDGEVVATEGGDPIYHVFDLLHLEGKGYRGVALSRRKMVLKKQKIFNCVIKYVEEVEGLSRRTLERLSAAGVREIRARDQTSQYHAGTSKQWRVFPLPASGKRQSPEKKPSPRLSFKNLDKVFWPVEGYTKGDVIAYYDELASVMLPHLIGKPQSLHRHPEGIHGPAFFQKDVVGPLPSYVKTRRIHSASSGKTIQYVLCENKETLLYLAQLGCIEINPWLSKAENPDHPDLIVIDLDPGERRFSEVIEVANEVHRILDLAGVKSFCKTSGSAGLHICIPTLGRVTYDEGRAFAIAVCEKILEKFSDLATLERNPDRRKGKLYLDCLQNRRGQTLAAAYSLRPRAGATASTPLRWEEVRSGLDPREFNIRTLPRRVREIGDLWSGMLHFPSDIPRALHKVNELKEAS